MGRGDLLEALLGGRVARIAIRMVLTGELAVGLLDLVRRGRTRHAQDLVGVLHAFLNRVTRSYPSGAGAGGVAAAITTLAGRRTRSPSR